jgi:hypothetical protein
MKFEWTFHALDRCAERNVRKGRVEEVIETEGTLREHNDGDGDWQLPLLNQDGEKCEVVYIHPDGDETIALVITILRIRNRRRRSRRR